MNAPQRPPKIEKPRPLPRFKTAAQFVAEYVPLSYAIEPIVRSNSLYTLTARTGAGKTGLLVVTALAVATGRPDVLGLEVQCGRVIYIACENADDVRMRLIVAAYVLNVDLDELHDRLIILDVRHKPEEIVDAVRGQGGGDYTLIVVDTLAALFDGDNANDAVQGGEFIRRLRPLTKVPGLPSVMVAAHPVKGAGEEQLVPYGSGAILNEVDGNLTLWKKPETGIVTLHWQGKLRGLEFQPKPFRFELICSPDLLDVRGRQVQLPFLRPCEAADAEQKEAVEIDRDVALLAAMRAQPNGSTREWSDATRIPLASLNRRLAKLEKDKLVEKVLGRWRLTSKGIREAESQP